MYKFNKYEFEGVYEDEKNEDYVNKTPSDTIVVSSAVLRSSLIKQVHNAKKTIGVIPASDQVEDKEFFLWLEQ